MPAIEKKYNSAFVPIPFEEFVSVKHRSQPDICKEHYSVDYYKFYTNKGYTQALLATPIRNNKNIFIFLFHGMGDDCTYPLWHWIDIFCSHGISVLSADLDGHGANDTSVMDFYSAHDSVAKVIESFCNSSVLKSLNPPPEYYVVSHSTGGLFALLALKNENIAKLIKKCIVVSPAVAGPAVSGFFLEGGFYLNPINWMQYLYRKTQYYGLTGLIPAFGKYKRKEFPIRLEHPGSYVKQLQKFVEEEFYKKETLKSIHVPVLWLHGMRDRVIPFKKSQQIMEQIPDLSSIISSDHGHMGMVFSDFSAQAIIEAICPESS